MSAATGLARQADGLEKLLALANLKSSDIAAAGEETRRQMQLTQDEEAKVAEARSYITKHSALSSELKAREDALVSNQLAHEKAVSDFASHVTSENTRLNDLDTKLNNRVKEQSAIEAANIAKAKEIADIRAENDRQHRDAMEIVKQTQVSNSAVIKANEEEAKRLKDWEATLKRKAELARQQMANF